jgi:uncharacterized protein (DUF1697 family)
LHSIADFNAQACQQKGWASRLRPCFNCVNDLELDEVMPQFVALLQGVNVGKNKRVPMEAWRAMLTALGYTKIKTLLNSGNAVFDATSKSETKIAQAIAESIQKALQLDVPLIVKSATSFQRIAAGNPLRFADDDHSRLLVSFCNTPESLVALSVAIAGVPQSSGEQWSVTTDAAYLCCGKGLLESALAEALLKHTKKLHCTTRNWATVLKIAALLDA